MQPFVKLSDIFLLLWTHELSVSCLGSNSYKTRDQIWWKKTRSREVQCFRFTENLLKNSLQFCRASRSQANSWLVHTYEQIWVPFAISKDSFQDSCGPILDLGLWWPRGLEKRAYASVCLSQTPGPIVSNVHTQTHHQIAAHIKAEESLRSLSKHDDKTFTPQKERQIMGNLLHSEICWRKYIYDNR